MKYSLCFCLLLTLSQVPYLSGKETPLLNMENLYFVFFLFSYPIYSYQKKVK